MRITASNQQILRILRTETHGVFVFFTLWICLSLVLLAMFRWRTKEKSAKRYHLDYGKKRYPHEHKIQRSEFLACKGRHCSFMEGLDWLYFFCFSRAKSQVIMSFLRVSFFIQAKEALGGSLPGFFLIL